MHLSHRNFACVVVLTLACGDAGLGSGTVQIFVAAEATIPDGLDPGTGEENVVDGWKVRYSKWLVTVGNFRAHRSAEPDDELHDEAIYVVDLFRLPAGGLVLTEFDGVAATRWDRFGYDLPNADDTAEAAEGTDMADRDFMVTNGYSIYFEGEITKPDGQSCKMGDQSDCVDATTINFRWGLKAGESFDDCASEQGDSGFAVPSGGTAQIKPTIHGDHWFFTNITQGAEITLRRAQWLADADLDRDGEATLDELRQVPAAALFTADLGYNLSGALIPIVTAYDYVEAQARTLGDFQGEGECPTRESL
jgi:hypothetical protein